MTDKDILDATCGGRSIWHPENKDRDDTLYIDRRQEDAGFQHADYDDLNMNPGYEVAPDEQQDFRDLPYADAEFNLIVFDPPHAVRSDGMETLRGVVTKKYGALHAETWQADLEAGFNELFRVLKPGGTLVFKFADESADFDEVLSLAPTDPLFGTSVNDGTVETRWFVFHKPEADA
jgi:SAM-dependent methyltransferase